MRRLVDFLRVAVQFAAALLAVLGVGELAVRVLLREAPPQANAQASTHFAPDDILKFRLEPDAHWTQTGDRGEFAVEYWTNHEGFRRGPGGADTQGDEVLVLGNSFVEGWGVPFDRAFINQAERRLRRPLRLRNFGMSGYSTAQSYLLLRELLGTRKPVAVLFVFTPGNLYDDRDFLKSALFDGDGLATGVDILRMTDAPAAPAEPWYLRSVRALEPTLGRSALYRLVLRGLTNRHRIASIRPGDPESDRFFFTRDGADYEGSLRTTLRYVQAMRDLCAAKGVRFLALVMPYGHEVAPWEWSQGRVRERLDRGVLYPDRPLLDIERRLTGLGVPTLGLVGLMRRKSRPDQPLYFSLDIHLNDRGNEQVGEALADWLPKQVPLGEGGS